MTYDYAPIDRSEFVRNNWGPHSGWWSALRQAIIITITRSNGGDWALNEKCLSDIVALRRAGKITAAEIQLTEPGGTVVAETSIDEVVANLAGQTANVGDFGSHFWINRDFKSVSPKPVKTVRLPW